MPEEDIDKPFYGPIPQFKQVRNSQGKLKGFTFSFYCPTYLCPYYSTPKGTEYEGYPCVYHDRQENLCYCDIARLSSSLFFSHLMHDISDDM